MSTRSKKQVWKPKPSLFNFSLLPSEIQCQILSYPLTLGEIQELSQVSQSTRDYIKTCLTSIDSADSEEEGPISPDLIFRFPKLETIRGRYFIPISSYQELIQLAKHPKLRVATFVLNPLLNTNNITDVAHKFLEYLKVPSFSCQDCGEENTKPTDYQFYFFYKDINNISHVIAITEYSLRFVNAPLTSNAAFFAILNQKFPICTFDGDLDRSILDLNYLTCLRSIYLRFRAEIVAAMYDLGVDTISSFFDNPNLEELDLAYGYDDRNLYFNFINDLIDKLESKKKKYPGIINIPIITLEILTTVLNLFPNLRSIYISLSATQSLEDEDPADYMAKIQTLAEIVTKNKNFDIFVVNDLGSIYLTNYEKDTFLNLFPAQVRNNIYFLKLLEKGQSITLY